MLDEVVLCVEKTVHVYVFEVVPLNLRISGEYSVIFILIYTESSGDNIRYVSMETYISNITRSVNKFRLR
jgi:hypothetical protein